jgi:hypothetical protein
MSKALHSASYHHRVLRPKILNMAGPRIRATGEDWRHQSPQPQLATLPPRVWGLILRAQALFAKPMSMNAA